MKKSRSVLFSVSAVFISLLITVFCILTGNYSEETIEAHIGKVSHTKVIAPRQIENSFATERRKQEAASSVTPQFKLDETVTEAVNADILQFFENLEIIKAEQAENTIEDGVSGEEVENQTEHTPILAGAVLISDEQYASYKTQTRATRTEFRDTLVKISHEILEGGIKDETDPKSLLFIRDELNRKPWPTELRNLGYTVVTAYLRPNIIVNDEATEAAIAAKVEQVNPVIVQEGQKVVDEGEIITDEIYYLLSEFGMLAEDSEKSDFTIVGAVAIVVLVFSIFICYVYFHQKHIIVSNKVVVMLAILYILAMLLVRFMCGTTFYIIPLSVPCLLIAVLIDERMAVFINFLIAVLAALIYKGGVEFILYFTVSGSIAVLLSKMTFDRTKIVIIGIALCAVNLMLITAINLFLYKSLESDLMFSAVIAMSNSLLSLLIAIGSLPIWEAVFDIITPVKLLDLTNPSHTLLRKLTIEAPGTYHHSLIVANLAEQAAHDINANAPLARVGGYYHDIGKLKHPYYFGENQAGDNAHDSLDPYDSAQLIMQHVSMGMELADHHKLPNVIKQIISQHHGTTLVKYFYYKAKEMYSESQVKEDDFRYKFFIPSGKESAIVMLADTAEAAVRSMVSSSKSMDEVEEFLRVLIKDKLDDEQLNDSLLTISELVTIRKSFMKVFRGMYHERVKYPTAKEKESELEKEIEKRR